MVSPCRLATAFLVAIESTAVGLASEMVFPDQQWEQATPESQHVDSRTLDAAVRYLETCGGSNGVKRLVIIRNGRMIWRGPEADRRQRVWSITKAFTSTAHGLLIEEGKCTMETLAKDYDPALEQYYSNVTLRHLATMTSGIDGVGGSYDADEQGRRDANALVEPAEPFFPPGTKYMYWDEATQHYGLVLTRIAEEPLDKFLQRRILQPIGVTEIKWNVDTAGKVLNWTGGIEISASDLARFGHLFLNQGRWGSRQLLDSSWVAEATRVQVPATIPNGHALSSRKGSGVYGYHWWPNGVTPDGKRRWPDAPRSTYARSGYNNNDLFIIPPWNMVIVRLGLDEQEDEITAAEYSTFLKLIGDSILDPVVEGQPQMWFPRTISFSGPAARDTGTDPNPFLDYRLQVFCTSPAGHEYNVAGFFDGDGHGHGEGHVWRARLTPDEPGRWTFRASFRQGTAIAVSLDPIAGQPTGFDGQSGSFHVLPADARASGFQKWGRLEYVGQHYLRFRDGPYWIRGGTDSPENFLAYAGFDDTPASHHFSVHQEDWISGDPDWGDAAGRGIIGAINYLSAKKVNSIYFLTMNVGGDGGDVWPWTHIQDPRGSPDNDNLHYDVSKLYQWETVFQHAEQKGLFLHFVLNEAEKANKLELDQGELGVERQLYYRELIARFGHHLALQWNLCEEYNLGFDFGPDRIRAFAEYINALDPYRHPITVHSAGDPLEELKFTFGDKRFSMTSIQLGQNQIDLLTEQFRKQTASSGRPLPVSLDEFTIDKGQEKGWIPVDDATRWRKEKLWPTYLSGGNIEFILGDLLDTESFKTPEREKLWDYTWYARKFLQSLPFWDMEPADELLTGADSIRVTQNRGKNSYSMGPQVFAKPGSVYAIYLPKSTRCGQLDLSAATGVMTLRWYNPRTGQFVGDARHVDAGKPILLGDPPSAPEQDWVVLIGN